MQMLMLDQHQLFICDTHVNQNPTAEQIADIALLAAEGVRRFGLEPRVALLSHSSFGSSASLEADKMRRARELVHSRDPNLAVEGEMRGDAALSQDVLDIEFPDSGFPGPANVLVMPGIDAANISYNLLRTAAGHGLTVGGILLGAARPAHILTPSSTVRRIVNMTALAVVDATSRKASRGFSDVAA
jgi:malate dehydrogenase (oxaloacetate-decarboxylating)(NADP+)